jgi:hypothetical protein
VIFQWQEMDLSDQTHGFFLHLNDEIWEGIVCQSEVAMPPRHGYVNIGKRKLETIGWNEILRQPQVGKKNCRIILKVCFLNLPAKSADLLRNSDLIGVHQIWGFKDYNSI